MIKTELLVVQYCDIGLCPSDQRDRCVLVPLPCSVSWNH